MRLISLSLVPLALLCVAAAPADFALRDRIVADAAAVAPVPFVRTFTATQSGGGEKESHVRVDRWDGKAWTLVSLDGKPPSADDAAKAAKSFGAQKPPGYHRLATLLAKAVPATDARGRTVLRVATLAPESFFTSGKDVSEHFTAEAVVTEGARPYVEQLRLTAREPFRLMLVAKVETFVTVSDYARDAGGTPRLVRQVADINGSMLGRSGLQHTETVYNYR